MSLQAGSEADAEIGYDQAISRAIEIVEAFKAQPLGPSDSQCHVNVVLDKVIEELQKE